MKNLWHIFTAVKRGKQRRPIHDTQMPLHLSFWCKVVRTGSIMAFFLVGFLTIYLRRKCFLSDMMSRQLESPATMSANLACRDSASERD